MLEEDDGSTAPSIIGFYRMGIQRGVQGLGRICDSILISGKT